MRRALECAVVVAVVSLSVPGASIARPAQGESETAPTFERDQSWPKPLPNNWRLGIVWAVSVESAGQHFFDVDSRGNIYTCGRFLPEKFVPTSLPVR